MNNEQKPTRLPGETAREYGTRLRAWRNGGMPDGIPPELAQFAELIIGKITEHIEGRSEMEKRQRAFEKLVRGSDKTINKIVLPFEGSVVEVPMGATGVKCGEQNGAIVLWYETYTVVTATRKLPYAILGTGAVFDAEFDHRMQHLETVVMRDGLVWHVYVGPLYDDDQ